jgi:hypothetical protein
MLKKERLVRTTVTLPTALKEQMSRVRINWSQEIREMISQRLDEDEDTPYMAEAVILNDRLRRLAPLGWKSLEEVKKRRKNGV